MSAARYTRKDAENAMARLAAAVGATVASEYAQEGAWVLDYAACYGGFVIRAYSPHGGESEPFGSGRVSAREFCGRVNFAVRAVELAKSGGAL